MRRYRAGQMPVASRNAQATVTGTIKSRPGHRWSCAESLDTFTTPSESAGMSGSGA